MTEFLVWVLIASGGYANGSSAMQPMFFKTQVQCEHAKANVKEVLPVASAKCFQANVLVVAK